MRLLLLLLPLLALAAAAPGQSRAPLDEDFGYVEVRPGAHMFWVMYHIDQEGVDHSTYPLIMWLQGGPGASGVGYGNFMELGPYDVNGNPREYAWTKKANVMFVDNPVGSGYSYVEDFSALATDNAMIASDLVAVVKSAFTQYPEMQTMPFYVFAESYGGKMTVDFALAFDQAIKNGEIVSDFRGVGLGDSWIHPMDSVNTWGMFLYQLGFVNLAGMQKIDAAAADTQAAVDAEQWDEATDLWGYTELVVMVQAHNVNFYNVLAPNDIYGRSTKSEAHSRDLSYMKPNVRALYEHHVRRLHDTRDALGDLMNGPQAEQWNIPPEVVWDSQGGQVFDTLSGDFMKPVVDSVVRLLTETNLQVVVFTGDLDLICDTPGTYRWIENMEWPDKPNFMSAGTTAIYLPTYSAQAATLQTSGQLSLYTLFRSGHMVPIDVPEMAHKMLDMIFASSKKEETKPATPKEHVEHKKKAPKHEELKKEEPKKVAPKQEAPKELNKVAPKIEEPKKVAPKSEEPKKEAPKSEPKKKAAKISEKKIPEPVVKKVKEHVTAAKKSATPQAKRHHSVRQA